MLILTHNYATERKNEPAALKASQPIFHARREKSGAQGVDVTRLRRVNRAVIN